MAIELNTIVKGKVKNIKEFGAFIQLPNKKVGLLHISEVSKDFVENIEGYLVKDQEIMVKVIELKEDGQIRLSAKELTTENEELKTRQVAKKTAKKKAAKAVPVEDPAKKFENQMKKFMEDSRETQMCLTKRIDKKHGLLKRKTRR